MEPIKTKIDRPNGQRIKGEVWIWIISRDEIKFSTNYDGTDAKRLTLTVNGIDYDGVTHWSRKFPAGQRHAYPWGDEAGWFGHDEASHLFSYPRPLTEKAREMLTPFFNELSAEIETKNPELFIEAEIERQRGIIEAAEEAIEKLQESIAKEQRIIDDAQGNIGALTCELEAIQSEKLSQLYEKANRIKQ